MNHLSAIAASVTDALNAADLSIPVVAKRSFKPAFDLQDLTDLRVTVVPQTVVPSTASRSAQQDDVTIDIGVQKRVDPNDLDAMDALLSLVTEIDRHLRRKPMAADGTKAAWIKSESQLVQKHLVSHRSFTAVVRLTYRTIE